MTFFVLVLEGSEDRFSPEMPLAETMDRSAKPLQITSSVLNALAVELDGRSPTKTAMQPFPTLQKVTIFTSGHLELPTTSHSLYSGVKPWEKRRLELVVSSFPAMALHLTSGMQYTRTVGPGASDSDVDVTASWPCPQTAGT